MAQERGGRAQRKPRTVSEASSRRGGKTDPGLRARLDRLIARYGTAAEFSRRCNVNPSFVSNWRNGKNEISLKHLQLIAERCGVSLDWLVLGDGGEEPRDRGDTWPRAELAAEIATWTRRAFDDAARQGCFQLGEKHFLSKSAWSIDVDAMMKEAMAREVEKLRAWLAWYGTSGAADEHLGDLLKSLSEIGGHLAPDNKASGALLLSVAAAAERIRAALGRHVAPDLPFVMPAVLTRDASAPGPIEPPFAAAAIGAAALAVRRERPPSDATTGDADAR